MPRVDFYVLNTTRGADRELFVCKLTEKAWQQGHRVYLHLPSRALAESMGRLLWTFRDVSFVPHDLYPDAADGLAPVRLGYMQESPAGMEVLINLTAEIPIFYRQFARIAEVIDGQHAIRQAGRARYRQYQEARCELHSHDIGARR